MDGGGVGAAARTVADSDDAGGDRGAAGADGEFGPCPGKILGLGRKPYGMEVRE